MLDETAHCLSDRIERGARSVLGVVVERERLGICLAKGTQGSEKLLSVGLVQRGRLAQFAYGAIKRLLLFRIDLAVLRHRIGEAVEASLQVRESGLVCSEFDGIASLSMQTRLR